MPQTPILWSFRRCPYAMRARLAIKASGVQVELREILLRDKPAAMLEASPKGTVPVLETETGVVDESFDVMRWALAQGDPQGWLNMPAAGFELIAGVDGPFKSALDRYKYHVRHAAGTREAAQAEGAAFLWKLDGMLAGQDWLYRSQSLADMAILPFVRQFANTERAWFDAQDWKNLLRWLNAFTTSDAFAAVMIKYPPWQTGEDGVLFS
ncbi:MAG: glutathione S-transferase [Yoonia sp.]|nr:glutathione S-transferase [Yoonia sp.]